MIKNFFKSTLRGWWKNKTFSFLNVFGLALGIVCAGLIFLWVEEEKSFDDNHTKKERLYSVQVNMNFNGTLYTIASTPRPMEAALRSEIPGIANVARVSPGEVRSLFTFNTKSVYAKGLYADSALFSMFTLPFVAGNPQTAFSQLHSLVFTEKAAATIFGSGYPAADLIGRTLRVDNKQDYTVTGILKDLPANSSLQFEWLAPFAIDLQAQGAAAGTWNSYGPVTYVELAPNADLSAVNQQLKGLIAREDPPRTNQAFLFPMANWRLYDQFENGKPAGGGRIEYVHMLSAIAWIILLIACINFMNLSTARSQQHAREIGVRKVLGAARGSLVGRFLLEAICMATLAGLIAVLGIALTLPAFNGLVEKHLSIGLGQPVHWLALLSVIMVCGLVAGSYPSLYLSSFNPVTVLKGWKIRDGSDALVRKGLVVLQFSLSIVFIIATITIFRQIEYVKDRNLGFAKDRLLEIDMQHLITPQWTSIRQDLLQTGVVEHAAMIDRGTLQGGNSDDRFDWVGKPGDMHPGIAKRNVSSDYVPTIGLHILAGRDFEENEPGWGDSAIKAGPINSNILITETMAKLIDAKDIHGALGKIVTLPVQDDKAVVSHFTVVGIVNDYVYGDMHGEPAPVIFFCRPPATQWDDNLLYVRTRAGTSFSTAISKLETVIRADNPSYPFQYAFVDDQFNALFQKETLMGETARVFAVLAVLISCLGLFGLAAYTAERRTREIGIRKVLGASVVGITGLLSKDFLKLVAVSCLIAFPVAGWMAHNWLKNYQYRISIGVGIFVAAGLLALAIAWITIGFQAVRAALANPVKSLRNE